MGGCGHIPHNSISGIILLQKLNLIIVKPEIKFEAYLILEQSFVTVYKTPLNRVTWTEWILHAHEAYIPRSWGWRDDICLDYGLVFGSQKISNLQIFQMYSKSLNYSRVKLASNLISGFIILGSIFGGG